MKRKVRKRTRELDRILKGAGIVAPKLVRKNTCWRNLQAMAIRYLRFVNDPKNAELIEKMEFYNNHHLNF